MLVLWAMSRSKADRQVRTLVRNLITVTTYVVAVISALVVYGVNVAVILTAAGVGTVAIGLAFQDLLRNVLAGIWLLLEQPFRLGDTITVMDQTGAVQNITLRTTTLRTGVGELAILPNLTVFTGIVVNTTHYDTRRLTVGVRIPAERRPGGVDAPCARRHRGGAWHRSQARQSCSSRSSTETCPCCAATSGWTSASRIPTP